MKKILGSSPATSIAGYVLSGLMIYQDMTASGKPSVTNIAVAIGIAVLGRLVKDSDGISKKKSRKIAHRVMPDVAHPPAPQPKKS